MIRLVYFTCTTYFIASAIFTHQFPAQGNDACLVDMCNSLLLIYFTKQSQTMPWYRNNKLRHTYNVKPCFAELNDAELVLGIPKQKQPGYFGWVLEDDKLRFGNQFLETNTDYSPSNPVMFVNNLILCQQSVIFYLLICLFDQVWKSMSFGSQSGAVKICKIWSFLKQERVCEWTHKVT